jgi:pyruvate/2-oxoglutarate dehydrogenase complex dihydrolipoamide dehydrogenase (E3) component
MEREGARYLFSLRLVPLFPFFLINLLMGLTRIPTLKFYWISQLGMLPGTLVYVNAGSSLAELESPAGILSVEMFVAFALIALLPWVSKWLLGWMDRRRVYQGFKRPAKFDTNMAVIGAGAGGLVSAYIAAAVKARVTLIEGAEMGGDCLNRGCVPSKALIRAGAVVRTIETANKFGVNGTAEVDFPAVMRQVRQVIAEVEPHDSVERYTGLGVDCVQGWARFVDPWTLEIEQQGKLSRLTAENIVVATGAKPRQLQIQGLSDALTLTSDSLWDYLSSLDTAPEHLAILGSGPVAIELAQALNRLGVRITLVVRSERILKREPTEAAQLVQTQLQAEGVEMLFNAQVSEASSTEQAVLSIQHSGGVCEVTVDRVLFALGREASMAGLGLEALDVDTSEVHLNEYLQTHFPHIYAVGDLAGPHQFTHAAAHQAWYASVNALFGKFKSFKVDYSLIPRVTFSDPQVAAVGLTVDEAKQRNIGYEVTRFDLEELDRAIAEGEARGYIEVLTSTGSDKILGVTITAPEAGDLLGIFCVAMRHKLGLNKLLSVVHAYPTMNEASKYVAGNWKRAHPPERLLKFTSWWFNRRLKS